MPSWSNAAIKLLLQNSVPLSDRIAQLPSTLASMSMKHAWTMSCADFSVNSIAKTNGICTKIAVSV